MAIVEVTITPIGTNTPSVSKYVALFPALLISSNEDEESTLFSEHICCTVSNTSDLDEKANNLKYQITPMSTIIEGI